MALGPERWHNAPAGDGVAAPAVQTWPVESSVLDAYLPDGLSPEADDGSAWLSVISVTNLTVRPKGLPGVLVERYHFYAQVQDGAVRDADSGHEPWTLYPVTAGVEANPSLAANGSADPDAEPVYYYSSGLDVIASRGKRVA